MSRACAALLIIGSCAGLVLGPVGVGTARADNKPRLLVLDVEGGSLTPATRTTLAQGLLSGLSASGVEVLRASDVRSPVTGGRGCTDAACWSRLQADPYQSPAYVVRPTVSMTGSTYQLRVEMLDPKTAKVVEAREDGCEICTDAEAAEALGMTASALKAAVFRKTPGGGSSDTPTGTAPASALPPVAIASAIPPAATPPGPVVGIDKQSTAEVTRDSGGGSRVRPVAGWVLVGAGVAAVAAGIALLILDHGGTCPNNDVVHLNPCETRYKTKVGGVAAIGSGLAAGLLGGWLLMTGPTAHNDRVASIDGWNLSLKRAF